MSAVGVMTWDWQDQPDVEQLDRILANLTNCRVRVFAVDAGGDQFAIVVAAAGDEQQTAGIDHRAAFDHWEATEGRADIFGWPLPVGSSGSSAVDPALLVALDALRRHHPRPAQQPAVERAARAIVAELEKQRLERGDDHIRLVGLGRTVEVRMVHNAVWLDRQALAEGVTNKAVDDAIAVTAHAMLREPGSSSGATT